MVFYFEYLFRFRQNKSPDIIRYYLNKYLILAFLFFIVNCILISPVIGSQVTISGGHLDITENLSPEYLVSKQIPKNSNLSYVDEKISSDLITLIAIQNDTQKNEEYIIQGLKSSKLNNSSNENQINGKVESYNSDTVKVVITIWPGNSTYILDPFIHNPADRVEGLNEIGAWVDISNLYTIANLPEVKEISSVPLMDTNIGTVSTEGDSILHSIQIRNNQLGPNGSAVNVGVISEGVENWSSSVSTTDLPDSLNVSWGTGEGDEGTAMLEIIHDIAPNSSLFFSSIR